jgi:hypothetical protein
LFITYITKSNFHIIQDLSRPAAALNTDAEHLTKIGHSSTSTHSKPTSGGVGSGHGSNGSTGTNIGGINAAKKKKAKKVFNCVFFKIT